MPVHISGKKIDVIAILLTHYVSGFSFCLRFYVKYICHVLDTAEISGC